MSFIVSLLLLPAVVLAVLTGLSAGEAEFFGLGDDLHPVAGWSLVVLAVLHTVLHAARMVGHAKRRFRRHFGVGGVIETTNDPERKDLWTAPFVEKD